MATPEAACRGALRMDSLSHRCSNPFDRRSSAGVREALPHRAGGAMKKGSRGSPFLHPRRRYCSAFTASRRPFPVKSSAPGLRMSTAEFSRREVSCAGDILPYLPTISAATPETCGAAIDVPAAQNEYAPLSGPAVTTAPGENTPSNVAHDRVMRATVQLPPPVNAKSPPGAPIPTTDRPMLVYDAGRSVLVLPSGLK